MIHDPDHWPMSETADRAALQRDIQSLWRTNAALLAQVKSLEADLDLCRARENVCAQVVDAARKLRTASRAEEGYSLIQARVGTLDLALDALDRLPKESA